LNLCDEDKKVETFHKFIKYNSALEKLKSALGSDH